MCLIHLTYRHLRLAELTVNMLRHVINLQSGDYLEFRLESPCLLPLLTGSGRHGWAFRRRDGVQKHKAQHPETDGDTGHCRVSVVCAPAIVW